DRRTALPIDAGRCRGRRGGLGCREALDLRRALRSYDRARGGRGGDLRGRRGGPPPRPRDREPRHRRGRPHAGEQADQATLGVIHPAKRKHLALLVVLVVTLVAQPLLASIGTETVEVGTVAVLAVYILVFCLLFNPGWQRRGALVLFVPTGIGRVILY